MRKTDRAGGEEIAKERSTMMISHPGQVTIRGEIGSWVSRYVRKTDHERRVVQIATALFDLTHDLHLLNPHHRRTLANGALVHDVGRSISAERHEELGAELIFRDRALRIDSTTRRHLAYLTRYHRGPVPEPARDDVLDRTDDHDSLLTILGLLRAADTLDSRTLEPPRIVMLRRGTRLDITCVVRDEFRLAQQTFCRPKKFRLLASALRCEVDVQVSRGNVRTA